MMAPIAYVFPNLRNLKEVVKCLKSPVWDDPSTGYMVNKQKHQFSLNASIFTRFIDQCERKLVEKTHS